MTDVPQLYRILPEVILTITGVIIMLAEPLLAKNASRRPLGWLAVLGTLAALAASHWQLGLPAGTAFFGTVQTDAFASSSMLRLPALCWLRFWSRSMRRVPMRRVWANSLR